MPSLPVSATVARNVKTLLESYTAAWRANSAAQLLTHWDLDYEFPTYLAEEIDHLLGTYAEIQDYWENNESLHQRVELSFSSLTCHPLDDNLLQVVFHMRWDIQFRESGRGAMGGDNRVVTLVKCSQEGCKLRSWVEAPVAAPLYLRRLYERDVRPEFASGHNDSQS